MFVRMRAWSRNRNTQNENSRGKRTRRAADPSARSEANRGEHRARSERRADEIGIASCSLAARCWGSAATPKSPSPLSRLAVWLWPSTLSASLDLLVRVEVRFQETGIGSGRLFRPGAGASCSNFSQAFLSPYPGRCRGLAIEVCNWPRRQSRFPLALSSLARQGRRAPEMMRRLGLRPSFSSIAEQNMLPFPLRCAAPGCVRLSLPPPSSFRLAWSGSQQNQHTFLLDVRPPETNQGAPPSSHCGRAFRNTRWRPSTTGQWGVEEREKMGCWGSSRAANTVPRPLN